MSKLIDVYFDVSMSNGHQGLSLLAKGNAQKGYCVFINRSWSALKMLTPNNVLLHYKSPSSSQPISADTIKYLPGCVSGASLNFNKALEASVNEKWAKWKKRRD